MRCLKKIPFIGILAMGLCSLVSVAGCSTYPIADPGDLKNARTLNNATLNHSDLVATAFVTREDVSRFVTQSVPQVLRAEVLERQGAVFVGVILRTSAAQTRQEAAAADNHALTIKGTNHPQLARPVANVPVPAPVIAQVQHAVHEVLPTAGAIYVSNDQTLTNHFHMFSSDHSTGRPTGSDFILDDIARVFPGYS